MTPEHYNRLTNQVGNLLNTLSGLEFDDQDVTVALILVVLFLILGLIFFLLLDDERLIEIEDSGLLRAIWLVIAFMTWPIWIWLVGPWKFYRFLRQRFCEKKRRKRSVPKSDLEG